MAGSLRRFNPAGELARFDPFRNMEDLFREFSMMPSLRGIEPESRIRMDITETEQAYAVKAEIPGVKKEDVKIAIDGNKVSISADMKEEKEATTEGNMVCSERYYGQQYRSFTLPQDVDESKAEAKYENGILSLNLPKKPGTGGRQITIQ